MASAKIITAWISFCQLKTSRIRATFTKITHTFENESKKKKWPQFLCNTLFVENKNVTELISDFYFYFYFQFLFLVEYFRIILENVQHYFRYIFSFISDFFFKINFYF